MSLAASALLLALFYGRPRGHRSGKAGLVEPRVRWRSKDGGKGPRHIPDQTTEKLPIPLPAPATDVRELPSRRK
jgi:hypothetical protein